MSTKFLAAFGFALPLLGSAGAQATVTGFVGPWAPTLANGISAHHGGTIETMTVGVSGDGQTLTAELANNGDGTFPSFFLDNDGYAQNLLPHGAVSFNYTIRNLSGVVLYYYGNIAQNNLGQGVIGSGASLSGTATENYTGGYFDFFAVNVSTTYAAAKVEIVLSNFIGPGTVAVPEPAGIALLATAFAGLTARRRR